MIPKICFVGAGNVSEHHIKAALASGFELHSICGRKGSLRAKKISEKFLFKNYLESVDDVDIDNLDAISIIVDPLNSVNIYKKFETTNLPILIEKPVALSSTELASLDIEREKTMVALNRRYYSSVNCFQKKLSKLTHFQGHANLSELSWDLKSSKKKQNEILKTNGIHFFDLILYLFGKPKSISHQEIFSSGENFGGSFLLNFGPNKVLTLSLNFGVPNNHFLEVYSTGRIFRLKPLEIFSETIGMEYNKIGKSEIKSYVPIESKDWKLSSNDITYKAGFLNMYKNFKGITIGDNQLHYANLRDIQEALKLAEKFETLLKLK
jgi:predicted dehydrogenase